MEYAQAGTLLEVYPANAAFGDNCLNFRSSESIEEWPAYRQGEITSERAGFHSKSAAHSAARSVLDDDYFGALSLQPFNRVGPAVQAALVASDMKPQPPAFQG
jgi:hypothetical protein